MSNQEINDAKNVVDAPDEQITVRASRIPEPPTPSFKLNNIKQSLYRYGGIQKTNLFAVTIKYAGDFLDPSFAENDLVFFCNRAALPGINFFTSDGYARYGVGLTERMPYKASFQETNLSFMGDGQGNILKFFENWTNKIINYSTANDISEAQPVLYGNENILWEPGEVAYKSEYQTEIQIELYDTAMRKVNRYTLYKAFPISVQDNQLAWASVDDFMEINTVFSFLNWKSEKFSIDQEAVSRLPGLTFLQKILKLGSVASTFAAIGKPDSIADIIQIVNNVNLIGLNRRNFF